MRFHLLIILALFGAITAHADAPFLPEVENRFGQVDQEKTLKFVYDTAVGTNGSSAAPHPLTECYPAEPAKNRCKLPAGAKITRSYLYVVTQFSDSGSGTVALSCEDANNIKTATDITGSAAGAFIEGQSTGAASAFVGSIAAACTVTATVAGVDQATGKLVGYVKYIVP